MPRAAKTAQKKQKKVAILGFAKSWNEAPFDDSDVEIWGLNELHKYVPRWDRWFELHDSETLGVTKRDLTEGEVKRHLEWLSVDHGKPIYMQDVFIGKFPSATRFPLADLCARFGRYFTSTIGYMIALAIHEGFDWIGLYGIDLASDIEYPNQRPNAEYLVGLARGMGIHVEIPETSSMLKAGFLYGYEVPIKDAGGVGVAVRGHKANLLKEHEKTLATLNTLDGAIQECDNLLKLLSFKDRGVHVTDY